MVVEKPNKKYTVRLPRGLASRFEKRIETAELEKPRKEEEKHRAEILKVLEVCSLLLIYIFYRFQNM